MKYRKYVECVRVNLMVKIHNKGIDYFLLLDQTILLSYENKLEYNILVFYILVFIKTSPINHHGPDNIRLEFGKSRPNHINAIVMKKHVYQTIYVQVSLLDNIRLSLCHITNTWKLERSSQPKIHNTLERIDEKTCSSGIITFSYVGLGFIINLKKCNYLHNIIHTLYTPSIH